MPKVSVIVPSYNLGKYLPETLESVMTQSFTDWECIIVENGSTDGSKDIVGAFARKDGRFVPTPEGAFFRELHAAKHAFYLESVRPVRNSTVLYPASGKETFYMVEIVPSRENLQYRLSRITRKGIREWLFDSGILEEPVLSAEDAVELNSLAEEDADQSAPEDRQVILGLRDYGPGGRILAEAEIFQTGAEQYIAGPDAAPAEVFTEEALDRLLDRCFGKEEHGHS